MKDMHFSREIKTLVNDVRSYGIQHCSESRMEILLSDSDKLNEFTIQVHKGFFIAQRSAIFLLRKILREQKINKINLKQARRDKDKEKIQSINEQIKITRYREMVVRKAMDAIAWQLFQYDLTTMRRLYYGQELIDITDSNLDSELSYVDLCLKEHPDCFVLISDLTSFIQIGDVVTFIPGKGLQLGELKEGKTNLEMFQLMDELMKVKCPYYMKKELDKLDEKKREQFFRDVKQVDRSIRTHKMIQDGEGTDLLTGLPIKIDNEEEIILSTFDETVNNLLNECTKKGYAISVIEECLLVGVYDTRKFPSSTFDVWAKSLNIKMPIVDLRQGIFDPLGYPIYLLPFKDDFIFDIISGKKVVKMTIDIEKWMETFEEDGIKWRWLSKKETARINSKFAGKTGIFALDGSGIEVEDDNGIIQNIGEGVFSRMFTGLNTPSSMKKLLIETMKRTKKNQDTVAENVSDE